MYNVKLGYLLLEIPKNGSRSLVQAACDHHGKGWMKCQGHHTFAEFADVLMAQYVENSRWPNNPIPTYAVFRNPVQRFESQVRQAYRKNANLTLNDIMSVAWAQSDIVFKPQSAYVAPPVGDWGMDLRMWDMERIEDAMSYIVGVADKPKKVTYRENRYPGNCPYTLDQIMAHPLYDDIMDTHYGDDFKWWIRATRTGKDGKE